MTEQEIMAASREDHEPLGPTAKQLAAQLVSQPYAWPGGYPLYAVTDDGGALCKKCCKEEANSIAESTEGDGWHINSLTVNYEDGDLHCDHCSDRIESAYAED
jgi:hypothetical protein